MPDLLITLGKRNCLKMVLQKFKDYVEEYKNLL